MVLNVMANIDCNPVNQTAFSLLIDENKMGRCCLVRPAQVTCMRGKHTEGVFVDFREIALFFFDDVIGLIKMVHLLVVAHGPYFALGVGIY